MSKQQRTRYGIVQQQPMVLAAVMVVVAMILAGCGQQRADESPSASATTADAVMTRMIGAYRAAQHYQDQAVVRLSYRRDGQEFADEAALAVAWQAPNRLHVRAYQAQVTCDGQQLTARIEDEQTRNFDGQVVVRPAPRRLTLRELWEEDQVLSLAFRQGLAGYPVQLDLLLSPTPLAALMQDDVQRSLLEPARCDDHLCHRIQIDSPDGVFVLWVDQRDYLLRRMEYPVATFAPEIAADPTIDHLQLAVECRSADLGDALSGDRFAVQIPPHAKRVQQLIPPPRELPSELFGKVTAPYRFATLTAESVTSQSLQGHIKVLVWFNNHPACESTIQQLNQVYQQYADQQRIVFQAVCAEASTFPNEQLQGLMKYWGADVPVVRDLEAMGRDLFEVPWAPTLVVLDEQDRVQIYEVGANPNLVAELPQVLEQLLAGVDVADAILDQFQQEHVRYEEALARGRPALEEDAATGPIASSTMPELLQLRPLWENHDLQSAGNVTAIQDPQGGSRFLVNEGYRTITEVGGQGNLLARHTLDLPEQVGVGQLHAAVDGDGQRYFALWSLRSRQVFVFDAQWKRILSYPEPDRQHEGIQDAVLADLDGDGQLELLVGFWGSAGLHEVSLAGTKRWETQEVSHVLSLAVSEPVEGNRQLWATSASGALVQVDHNGRAQRLARQSGQLMHHIFCGQSAGTSDTPWCAIAYGLEGRRLALGLSADATSQWRYSLPAGSFEAPVHFVTSARLLDPQSPVWMIAGPDGSVHVISPDGRFTDHFCTGLSISGLAGAHQNGAGIMVVSSPEGLHAWQLSPPATARAD